QLRASLLMGLETPSSRAEQIASQWFTFGRILPLSELTAKLDAVDSAAVRRIGAQLMTTERPSIAAVGPLAKLEPYDRFAERFGASARRAAE
ncbi:MAG TPA: hypothetical protein VK759_02665, partial [Rhizomicrobium sp.]|nr:hypothetical protein [Rhizomicrobium sp.]